MEAKMSIMVIGSTGSGKTTILNAITGLVNPDFKIFSVEDVAEINIKHENWFSLVSRVGFGNNEEGEIGLYELIKSGVRHRPDYIVVGEIRGFRSICYVSSNGYRSRRFVYNACR